MGYSLRSYSNGTQTSAKADEETDEEEIEGETLENEVEEADEDEVEEGAEEEIDEGWLDEEVKLELGTIPFTRCGEDPLRMTFVAFDE